METKKNLTLEDIHKAIKKLKEHNVTKDYIVRLNPYWVETAFDLGFEPFCPLYEEDVIEFKING